MYSSRTKVEYATDITLVKIKKLSSATQKGANSFDIADPSTAFSFIIFSHVFAALCI
jgi:hypothetical protein